MRHSLLRRKLGAYRAIPWQKRCASRKCGPCEGMRLQRGAMVNLHSRRSRRTKHFRMKRSDFEKLTFVALKLSLSLGAKGSVVVFKSPSLQGKKTVNFPDFVEWCRENGVGFKVGLDLRKGQSCPKVSGARPFPLLHVWEAPMSGMDWNLWRPVTASAQFAELQHVLDLSYKKIWSRDRKATGDTRVPDAYKLVRASRNENYSLWANCCQLDKTNMQTQTQSFASKRYAVWAQTTTVGHNEYVQAKRAQMHMQYGDLLTSPKKKVSLVQRISANSTQRPRITAAAIHHEATPDSRYP